MKKRKKASPSASRSARNRHTPAPSRAAGAARATRSIGRSRSDARRATLTLPAECLVSDAGDLKEQLAGLLDEPGAVTLDITALQRIDTAGLQLITAFVRERAGLDRPVEWHGAAAVLTTAAQLLGLTTLLKLPA